MAIGWSSLFSRHHRYILHLVRLVRRWSNFYRRCRSCLDVLLGNLLRHGWYLLLARRERRFRQQDERPTIREGRQELSKPRGLCRCPSTYFHQTRERALISYVKTCSCLFTLARIPTYTINSNTQPFDICIFSVSRTSTYLHHTMLIKRSFIAIEQLIILHNLIPLYMLESFP